MSALVRAALIDEGYLDAPPDAKPAKSKKKAPRR
jgi:hypothetical protein